MEERNTYKKMMGEQLNRWKNKLNALKTKAVDVKRDTKSEYSREMDALDRKVKGAERQLKKLNEADDHKWNACKTVMEETMSEVKRSLDKLGQKLT